MPWRFKMGQDRETLWKHIMEESLSKSLNMRYGHRRQKALEYILYIYDINDNKLFRPSIRVISEAWCSCRSSRMPWACQLWHSSHSSICFIRAQISPLTASLHPSWAKPLEKHRAQHERDATSFLVKCVACIGNRNTAKGSSRKVIVCGLCGSSIGVAKRNQLCKYMLCYTRREIRKSDVSVSSVVPFRFQRVISWLELRSTRMEGRRHLSKLPLLCQEKRCGSFPKKGWDSGL